MKISNLKVKIWLFISSFFLMLFVLSLLVNSNAATEIPKITISGASDSMVTGELVDSYGLTIDYSQVDDLTNLQLYYKVDDGEWKNVSYDNSKTSVQVVIRGGVNGLSSDKALHKISVYAENDEGKSEILEKEVLFYYFANKTLKNAEYDVTVDALQYPLNSLLEVEKVTDKNILSKIPLENMTLYKITMKADTQLAGPLLKKYKKYPDQSSISVTVPLSESVKKAIENGVSKHKVGYSVDKEYKYQQTSWNFADDSATNYFKFASTYTKQILDDGYVYLAIATGEKTNNSDDENTNNTVNTTTTNSTNENETKNNVVDNTIASGKLPQTGITSTVITILAVVSIACAFYAFIRIKNMKNID